MPLLKLDDTALFYEDQGQGPPVLLIHGFPFTSRLWKPQTEALAGAGYRVLVPDLRGFGNTPLGNPGKGSISTYVKDLQTLLNYLGVQRLACVGMSMGGYIMLELLPRKKFQLEAAAFCFTRAGRESEEGRKKRNNLIRKLQIEGPRSFVRNILDNLSMPQLKEKRKWGQLAEHFQELQTPGLQFALEAMRDRGDSTKWLSEITCPSLVISGSKDKMITAEVADSLAKGLPRGKLSELTGVGHLGNLEDPKNFNKILLEFFQQEYPPQIKED